MPSGESPPPGRRLNTEGDQPRSSPTRRSSVTARVRSAGQSTSRRSGGEAGAGGRGGTRRGEGRGATGSEGTPFSGRPASGSRRSTATALLRDVLDGRT